MVITLVDDAGLKLVRFSNCRRFDVGEDRIGVARCTSKRLLTPDLPQFTPNLLRQRRTSSAFHPGHHVLFTPDLPRSPALT